MFTLIMHQAAAALGACGAVLFLWSPTCSIRRSRKGAFCPGPKVPWVWLFVPTARLLSRRCGYNLAGLPRTSDGILKCPECARTLRGLAEALPRARRFPSARLGLTMLLLAPVLHAAPYIRSGKWAKWAPNSALVTIKHQLGPFTPRAVRAHLAARSEKGEMSPKLLRRYAVTLVHDLKADDVPGNAEDAIALLEQFRIAPPLEEALESSDWQQRQLAASVLRDLIWENPSIPVSDQLLQVTIEGLRSDDLPFGPSHTMWVLDARYGFNFLCQFPERIGPLIAPGLESDDPQQRLLCAAVAGFTHQATLTDHAAPILIEALLDNSTEGDAMVATPALARFGPGIAPYLIPYLDDPDPQRRELVHRILDSVGLTLRFDNLPVAGAPPPLHIAGVRRAAALTKNEPVEQWDRWFP